ncbi:MAG TPA: ATP-grasp domain-containing protein [Candidatus Acidoferrales bacterium]|nr:ATP-grasp domain-containing protein [Candidatus Acidoferrales bacterium]
MTTKPVMLLAAVKGYELRLFLEAARKLGLPVALGTDRCHMLDDPWRDGAVPLKFEKPETAAERVVDFARRNPVQAILPLGDRATLTAALACQALNLPCNSPEAVEACRNKFVFRQRLQAAGLPGPWFARFAIDEDPRECVRRVQFPCVLKPLALSASRGVIRADSAEEFVTAFQRVAALLKRPEIQAYKDDTTDWLLAEGYLAGRELALEGLLDAGRLRVLALFDKPDPLDGPFFEETVYVTPSREDAATQQGIIAAVEQAARALGLQHGPVHAELRLTPEGPRILEVAARNIGGLCARALRFQTGYALPELILRHAAGLPIDPAVREDAAAGVMMVPIPQGGIYEGAEGVPEALKVPGIEDVVITAKEDHYLEPLPEGATYLGFIFARARTPEEAEQALRTAHGCLRFRIAPRLPVARRLERQSR